jgi:hypothetical protein
MDAEWRVSFENNGTSAEATGKPFRPGQALTRIKAPRRINERPFGPAVFCFARSADAEAFATRFGEKRLPTGSRR